MGDRRAAILEGVPTDDDSHGSGDAAQFPNPPPPVFSSPVENPEVIKGEQHATGWEG